MPSRKKAPYFLSAPQQIQVWVVRPRTYSTNMSCTAPVCSILLRKPSSVCVRGAHTRQEAAMEAPAFPCLPPLTCFLLMNPHALWNIHWYLVFRYHAFDLCSAFGWDLVYKAFWAWPWSSPNFSSRAAELEPMITQLDKVWTLPAGEEQSSDLPTDNRIHSEMAYQVPAVH